MSSGAKNIAIAQPRKENPRKNKAKSVKAIFTNPNSTMNSLFNFGTVTSRKCETYNLSKCVVKGNDKDQKKREQANLEAQVGQMDRLNRLKANNRSKENKSC